MYDKGHNVIVELTFVFALNIISYCDELDRARKYVVCKQLLKSGTSIGANVRESQSSESRADFIHKMKIAGKETQETIYWLTLCKEAENFPPVKNSLIDECETILRIISKIIHTSKTNQLNNL